MSIREFIKTAELDGDYEPRLHKYIETEGIRAVLSTMIREFRDNPRLVQLLTVYKDETGHAKVAAFQHLVKMSASLPMRQFKAINNFLTHPTIYAVDDVLEFLLTEKTAPDLPTNNTYVFYRYKELEDMEVIYAGQSLDKARELYKAKSELDPNRLYIIQIWDDEHKKTEIVREKTEEIYILNENGDKEITDSSRLIKEALMRGSLNTDIVWLKMKLNKYGLFNAESKCEVGLGNRNDS